MNVVVDKDLIVEKLFAYHGTQNAFRQELGVSSNVLSKSLKGMPIQMSIAKKISDKLGIPLADLVVNRGAFQLLFKPRLDVLSGIMISRLMTPGDFAELVGCSKVVVSKLMQGGGVRKSTALKIASALGMEIEELFEGQMV